MPGLQLLPFLWKWYESLKIQEKSCIGQFVICFMCEVLIIDTWNEYINEMFACPLFKELKKFNEFCSLSKAARMPSTYLKENLGFLRLYSFSHVDSWWETMKKLARTGAKGELMPSPSTWLKRLLLKRKWVYDAAKRKTFLSSF